MTLLNQLIEGATDGGAAVADLLRKVKVLASRLGAEVVDRWVEDELQGYGTSDLSALPPYRAPRPAFVQGEFLLPFSKTSSTLSIAPAVFPADFPQKDRLFELWLTQPISQIEEQIEQARHGGKGELRMPWPADHVALTNTMMATGRVRLYTNAALFSAWRVLSVSDLVAVADAVRTRILDFALALERLSPDAGERGAEIAATQVATVVYNVFGDYAAIAHGGVAIGKVTVGDELSLLTALREAGLGEDDLTALREALAADREANGGVDPRLPGAAAQSWLQRVEEGFATAVGQAATGAAGGIISGLFLGYFGLHT